ncbi:TrkH family potassium uptake protein [Anatilimnocola aggregata]|nr:potassium transporter TrkG [Anatilimnocola aggregata]
MDKARKRSSFGRWDIRKNRALQLWQRITPPQFFVASFALLILIGTLGLKLLPGLYTREPLSWIDALFTSTSAVCVTGLSTFDMATRCTWAGQAWILLLIQLGGLGMLTFASMIIVALGRRLSLRGEAMAVGGLEAAPHIDPRQLTFDVVRFTFLIEGVGALALYLLWIPKLGFAGALWPAIFHSVSSFCNAGFSVFSDSLMSYQQAPLVLLVHMALIIAGGLGFLTMEELALRYQAGKTRKIFRLSLHSRIVLITSLALLVIGWIFFCIFEWNATLRELPIVHKLTNGLFMSVTSRTAGFNSINYGEATDSSNFLTIILMTIGGSPGSTAGGIKTTTFALIGLLALSRLKGEVVTTYWNRSIRNETTARAVGLFVISFGIVTAGIFILTVTETFRNDEAHFLDCMFEAASAFGTVGLSTGITPQLSIVGRWTAIILMFLGRVGPLTLTAVFMVRQSRESSFRYSYEDVVVG